MEAAKRYLLIAIVSAVPIIIFVPAIIEYYPYEVTMKTVHLTLSNALWGSHLNNSDFYVAPTSCSYLPSYEGDFLQASGKTSYELIGDAFSNASVTFAILDNSSFHEFVRNSSAVVGALLRMDIDSGQVINFSLPLTDDGLYYYVFLSKESFADALVRFNLNETWSFESIVPDVQFSIMKGIVPPVAVVGGAVLLAISLVKLRRLAAEIPETQPGQPPAEP